MAMVEYDRGQDSTLRRIGYDIATTQQYQVGVMEGWLAEWRLPQTTDRAPMAWVPGSKDMLQPDGRMPGLASTDELARLEAATGKDADILFCQLMLRHHLGGIHMIDAVLAESDNDRVRELAEQMRQAQQGEIEALRELLKVLGRAAVVALRAWRAGNPRAVAGGALLWFCGRAAGAGDFAPVAQGIEHRPPEAGAQVRILPGARHRTATTQSD